MAEHKISYQKEWDSDGTCYRQMITVTMTEWLRATVGLKHYAETIKDALHKSYLEQHIENCGNICFVNLSQRDYIVHALGINKEKRYTNNNTRFKVIR